MDNDIKIDNLFKKIFENINNPIIDILKNTKEIKTSEKLDEITRYLYKNFNPIQVKDILAKNNIIYDKQDRNFSAKNYNTFTNLIRDIDNNNIITNYSQVNEELFAPPINAYNNNIFSPTSVQKWIGSWDHIEESEFLTDTSERSGGVSMNTPFYNHVSNPDKQLFFPNMENNLLPSESIYQNNNRNTSINIPSFDESNKIITPTSNYSNIPEGIFINENNERYISSQNYSRNTFEKSHEYQPQFSQTTVLPVVDNNYNLSMYDSSLPPNANYSISPEMTGPGETMLNSLLLSNIQKQIDNLKADEIGCDERIEKVKKDYQSTINNYIDILLKDLIKNEVITEIEANTMKKKLQYQEIDNQTLIKYLQDKQIFNKKISINNEYNKFMENKFMNNNYLKPPVCVTNFPQKITQFDPYDTMYAVNK